MSEMMDKLKELYVEKEDPRAPMDQALVIALNALKEIQYCAACGSTTLCEIEAKDALERIDMLKVELTKVEEDNDEPTVPNIVVVEA